MSVQLEPNKLFTIINLIFNTSLRDSIIIHYTNYYINIIATFLKIDDFVEKNINNILIIYKNNLKPKLIQKSSTKIFKVYSITYSRK